MRLEQGRSGVQVKMLAGSAIYDFKSQSTVSVPTVSRVRNSAPAQAEVIARAASRSSNQAAAEALVYRMPATAPQSGIVMAPAAISSAQFLPVAGRQAYTSPDPGSNHVMLPNGMILQVTPSGAGQYTINAILVPVTNAGGQLTYATVVSSPLLGAGLTVANTGTSQQQVTIFSGSTAMTPDDANTALQNAAQNALTNAPGATGRPAGPITVNPLSPGGDD
jgi:hypothetical protein